MRTVEIDDVRDQGRGEWASRFAAASPVLRANSIRDCLAEGVLILGRRSAVALAQSDCRRNKGAGVAARDGAKPVAAGNTFDRNVLEPAATDAVKGSTSVGTGSGPRSRLAPHGRRRRPQ